MWKVCTMAYARWPRRGRSAMREDWERAMKIEGMRIAGGLAACLLGLVTLAQPGRLMAQVPVAAPTPAVAPGTASIHGHITSPLGPAITEGEVRLTTDRDTN